jgi:hypothetical protein
MSCIADCKLHCEKGEQQVSQKYFDMHRKNSKARSSITRRHDSELAKEVKDYNKQCQFGEMKSRKYQMKQKRMSNTVMNH